MNGWSFTAKKFLVGEYIAISGGPAIVLTTTPCFEIRLSADISHLAFHPDSPAGQFWSKNARHHALSWHDPYRGLGGLGASSAQFLGAYFADAFLLNKKTSQEDLLKRYLEVAWSGQGMRPSGYDVLAQSAKGCVIIERNQQLCNESSWPFADLAFILIHTGYKLPTHEHLKILNSDIIESVQLHDDARRAIKAFETASSDLLMQAVNGYQRTLQHMNLVASTTQSQIIQLQEMIQPLAIKGCGAMGADVMLMLIPSAELDESVGILKKNNQHILATSSHLFF
jgi:mevalonate kinase